MFGDSIQAERVTGMSPIHAQPDAPRASPQSARPKAKTTPSAVWRCLLVSSNDGLIEGMRHAAAGAGWDCVACRDPQESLRLAMLHRFALALVDIDPVKNRRVLSDLFRLITGSEPGLVVAYDGGAAAASELWAREHGAWMYVPGVDDWSDLELVCREARRITDKIRERNELEAST